MENVKLSIIYYSQTGNNFKLAKIAQKAAEEAGAEVRLRKVEELLDTSHADHNEGWKKYLEESKDVPVASSDDLEWADAILFSMPTRFGNVPAQMKFFIDQQGGLWADGKLVNKAVSAMTSAQNKNGGEEQTINHLYTSMFHWGAIIVPQGYTDDSVYAQGGNPYGTSVTIDRSGFKDDVEGAVINQTKRLLDIAAKIK
ncbi:MAG: NAD(P)H:quinone oxidoreductase [Finegoldia sp.]|nr:NAD(P)H:quinone oxidoreductase [Finegoldia sp.]